MILEPGEVYISILIKNNKTVFTIYEVISAGYPLNSFKNKCKLIYSTNPAVCQSIFIVGMTGGFIDNSVKVRVNKQKTISLILSS